MRTQKTNQLWYIWIEKRRRTCCIRRSTGELRKLTETIWSLEPSRKMLTDSNCIRLRPRRLTQEMWKIPAETFIQFEKKFYFAMQTLSWNTNGFPKNNAVFFKTESFLEMELFNGSDQGLCFSAFCSNLKKWEISFFFLLNHRRTHFLIMPSTVALFEAVRSKKLTRPSRIRMDVFMLLFRKRRSWFYSFGMVGISRTHWWIR